MAAAAPMLDKIGRGWTATLVAAVWVLMSSFWWAIMRWGPKWREQKREKEEAREKRQEEKQRDLERAENSEGSDMGDAMRGAEAEDKGERAEIHGRT